MFEKIPKLLEVPIEVYFKAGLIASIKVGANELRNLIGMATKSAKNEPSGTQFLSKSSKSAFREPLPSAFPFVKRDSGVRDT
jgi:hypothetical protein